MIRKADFKDLNAIRKTADVVFRHTYREILSPEQMEYMMDMMYSESSLRSQFEGGHVFFISEGPDGVEGYVSIRPDGAAEDGRPRFHLEKLYVLPERAGQGLGRILFDRAAEHAVSEASGHARVELNVNRENPAVGFYEHLGMKKARSGDFPIGSGFYMNDFIMAIDL